MGIPHQSRLLRERALGILTSLLIVTFVPAWQVLAQEGASGDFTNRRAVSDGPVSTADDAADDIDKLMDMADEDLAQVANVNVTASALQVEVSTVARQTSTVGRSAAAVFVITPEMIRRSGANCVPEVLRMVPGLHVARTTANSWAVTSRGFNGSYANKLLVQIDGRSVYTPLFAGTFWGMHNTPLEDIERIEVIRGPGATVWGANAVNGVINIITKKAHDTHGVMAKVGGGTEERDFATFRYGGWIGRGLNYRVYGNYNHRDDGYSPAGNIDETLVGQTGFRMDWDLDPCQTNKITIQGDYFEERPGKRETVPLLVPPFRETRHVNTPLRGGNLLARWTHTESEDSDFALQFYHDRHEYSDALLRQATVGTYDIDFQHRFRWTNRQKIVWGLGYRSVNLNSMPSVSIVIDPPEVHTDLYSAFIQDEITLVDDRLYFTAGCKGEHNDFTGYVFQPTARLVWLPSERSSAWAAFSRAVRTPSLIESQDGLIRTLPEPPLPSFLIPTTYASRDFRAEELLAYELGYRAQPIDEFSWDLTLFHNVYEDLRSFDLLSLVPPVFMLSNRMAGDTYGVELAGQWDVTPSWRLSGHYTFLRMQLHSAANTPVDEAAATEGQSPQNQVYLQSSHDLSHNIDFDVIGRYVGSMPAIGIPSYISLDMRLAWRPSENLELAIVGQSLLDSHREEYRSEFFGIDNTEVQRGVYGMATWRY